MEKENEKSEEESLNTEKQENVSEEIKVEEPVQEQKKDEELEQKEEETIESDSEENKKELDLPKKEKNKNNKKKIIILFILIILLLFISTIFAIVNMNNDNIAKGVYIEGLEVSNLNKEKINDVINSKIAAIEDVEVVCGNYESIIKLEDMGLTVNAKDAIKKSIEIGKTNNIIIDNYSILKSMLFKTKLNLDVDINEDKFKDMIKKIQAELPEAVKSVNSISYLS